MIFGKPEQKGKPAEAGTPMPSAATLPPTAAAPAPPAAAATEAQAPSAPSAAAASASGSAPAAAGSSASPRERQAATIRYLDRPDVTETFADSITGLVFDGQTLRIEFSVTRVDEVKPDSPITGRRYPASRIVLSPGAAIELINRMQQIGAALTQAGVAKTTPGRGQKPPSS
jgi:hypothetical protein